MSLGYPAIRPKQDGAKAVEECRGLFGVPQVMNEGFQNVRSDVTVLHPLEFTEQNWQANQEKMDFAMLKNIQGIHAPLRLQMERNVAHKVQRLPCLSSSNIMLDTLTGKADTIEPEDFLNNPMEFCETMGEPHAMVEKRLGLL